MFVCRTTLPKIKTMEKKSNLQHVNPVVAHKADFAHILFLRCVTNCILNSGKRVKHMGNVFISVS